MIRKEYFTLYNVIQLKTDKEITPIKSYMAHSVTITLCRCGD
jgi:hypothetical protein